MSLLSRTTRLGAVNIALASAHLLSVESLSSGDVDAEIAENILDETTVEVQTRGWYWNTDILTLAPDNDGHIVLPENFIKVDAVNTRLQVVQRGSFLYDKTNTTKVFDGPIELTVVIALEYEELPQSCRRYIAMKTSRIFQGRILGDASLANQISQEESFAWQQMIADDVRLVDYNHITDGPAAGIVLR